MQKGCSLINMYLTGVVNDQTYSVFSFVCFNGKVTARNAIISSISHLMHGRNGTVINRRRSSVMKTKTFDVLRAQR